MSATHCPLCYSSMESRLVAPCMDCGNLPEELDHLAQGKHTYAEYRVFGALNLVLCDFCVADFSSYDFTYFGFSQKTPVARLTNREFIRPIYPVPEQTWDKVCPNCQRRLSFLNFVISARE